MKVIHAPNPHEFIRDVELGGAFLEVYDLGSDPGERTNITAGTDPRALEAVSLVMKRARNRHMPRETSDEGEVPNEFLEQLKSMGYAY